MNYTIAVITGENGCTTELLESYQLKIYSKQGDEYKGSDCLEYHMDIAHGLAKVRQQIKELEVELSSRLDSESKVLVGRSVTGIPYNIFDAAGYTIFEIDGEPERFVGRIVMQLQHQQTKPDEGETVVYTDRPIETGDGHFFIDLKTLQIKKPGVTSKQALMPFFDNMPFISLEIICAHIPPWFDRDFDRLGLCYTVKQEDGPIRVLVAHKVCVDCEEGESSCVN